MMIAPPSSDRLLIALESAPLHVLVAVRDRDIPDR
jgi:hypothetical protein